MRKTSSNNPTSLLKSEVRIIGGQMRGRKIRFNAVDGLRPTLDRVRETLFNWLAADIHGSVCLDLFAGSGVLGFEAISRGAKNVVMVEKDVSVWRNLKANSQLLKLNDLIVVNTDHQNFLASNELKFDVVFLDPPFSKDFLSNILDQLKPHLNQNALLYVEHEAGIQTFKPDSSWETLKHKSTGSIVYSLLLAK